MTNLEKWKIRVAEAEDGRELVETLDEMERAMALSCRCCVDDNADCKECEDKELCGRWQFIMEELKRENKNA